MQVPRAIRSQASAPGLPATRSSPTGWCWWTWAAVATGLAGFWAARPRRLAGTVSGFHRHLHRARDQLARRRRGAARVGRRGSRGRERVIRDATLVLAAGALCSLASPRTGPSRAHVASPAAGGPRGGQGRVTSRSLVARAIGDPGGGLSPGGTWRGQASTTMPDRLVDVPESDGVLRVEAEGAADRRCARRTDRRRRLRRARLGGPSVAAGCREPPSHRGTSGQPGAGA